MQNPYKFRTENTTPCRSIRAGGFRCGREEAIAKSQPDEQRRTEKKFGSVNLFSLEETNSWRIVTKTCVVWAISKEKLTKKGLVSCLDYYLNRRHILKLN